MKRSTERVEFTPATSGVVCTHMDQLRTALDGWINFLPGIDPDDAPGPPTPLSSLFGGRKGSLVMVTWKPEAITRRRPELQRLGFQHPGGRRILDKLRTIDLDPPKRWVVEQDHARSLIIAIPPDVEPQDVLDWMLPAATALCTTETTGSWRAEIHLPIA